jgi:hypothetical protein
MEKSVNSEYQEKTKADIGHTIAKAALSSIPIGGGAVTALFEHVFFAPIDRRREKWLHRLSETVNELVEKVDGLTEEDLSIVC